MKIKYIITALLIYNISSTTAPLAFLAMYSSSTRQWSDLTQEQYNNFFLKLSYRAHIDTKHQSELNHIIKSLQNGSASIKIDRDIIGVTLLNENQTFVLDYWFKVENCEIVRVISIQQQ